jgi:hypothetical protein
MMSEIELQEQINELKQQVKYLMRLEKNYFSSLNVGVSGAEAGGIVTAGKSDLAGTVRVVGNADFASGEGLELAYILATHVGYLTAYDRTGVQRS